MTTEVDRHFGNAGDGDVERFAGRRFPLLSVNLLLAGSFDDDVYLVGSLDREQRLGSLSAAIEVFH